MAIFATKPIQPYRAIPLQDVAVEVFTTSSGAEIHPMWSGEGNLSYFLVNPNNREAILIDPDLEILGSYLLTLEMQQLKLVAVIDTHTHAEHVSAGPELKKLLGVEYLMFENTSTCAVSHRVGDNQELVIAGLKLKFLHCPGHTLDLMCILLDNHLFTGDSLFLHGCGRADFPVSDPGRQFDSMQRLKQLPDDTMFHPGHNYNNELTLSLGESRKTNKRLEFTDRNEFIRFMNEFYENEEKPENWEWYAAFNAR